MQKLILFSNVTSGPLQPEQRRPQTYVTNSPFSGTQHLEGGSGLTANGRGRSNTLHFLLSRATALSACFLLPNLDLLINPSSSLASRGGRQFPCHGLGSLKQGRGSDFGGLLLHPSGCGENSSLLQVSSHLSRHLGQSFVLTAARAAAASANTS